MYSEHDREVLLDKVEQFMYASADFEGLFQIGSGASGYTDIFSDIDLMAGCAQGKCITAAHEKMIDFFKTLEPIYIDQRRWSESVLGLSVYFSNGLSVDVSYMPTEQIRLRSPAWKVLFSKTERFSSVANNYHNAHYSGLDDSVHHKFIYALRRCEIAMYRSEFVYADIALAEARQILLLVEAAREGKKTHQFKLFNTLNSAFLEKLNETYPSERDFSCLKEAKEQMLAIYLDVVDCCDFLTFDEDQLKLLNRFEMKMESL